jgi:hypothetical protein
MIIGRFRDGKIIREGGTEGQRDGGTEGRKIEDGGSKIAILDPRFSVPPSLYPSVFLFT